MAAGLASTADAMRPPAPDSIEVLMTLSEGQYAEMDRDLEVIREQLKFRKSTSNTAMILAAVAAAAGRDEA